MPSADYVIVGAGSAGCVLANRLSEDPDVRVLLLEAGNTDGSVNAKIPAAFPNQFHEELEPGPSIVEDEDLADDIRKRLMPIYHPVGTCRMSDTAEEAVVDPELRVHGLRCLRVVDASVMPVITGGNTNAPTMMIAERGADLIRGRVGSGAATAGAAA